MLKFCPTFKVNGRLTLRPAVAVGVQVIPVGLVVLVEKNVAPPDGTWIAFPFESVAKTLMSVNGADPWFVNVNPTQEYEFTSCARR